MFVKKARYEDQTEPPKSPSYTAVVSHSSRVFSHPNEVFAESLYESVFGDEPLGGTWNGSPVLAAEDAPVESDDQEWTASTAEPRTESENDTKHKEEQEEEYCNKPHALDNFLVMSNILEYLQVEDLKICRLVSKRWNSFATPPMLLKGVISLDAEDVDKLADLQGWMESLQDCSEDEELTILQSQNSHSKRGRRSSKNNNNNGRRHRFRLFKNFVCDKITHHSYPNVKAVLGPHVESFTVSHWWNDSRDLLLDDYDDLLLNTCPNLKELNIPATENFTQASKFLMCQGRGKRQQQLHLETLIITGDVKPAQRFWKIINKSPKLKFLKLDCQISEEFWKPEGRKIWNERMRNLQKLEVRSYGNESISRRSSNYFLDIRWTLKMLSYECYVLSDAVMHACSEHVASTMEDLNIVLFNKQYEPWPADRGKDWMIPPSMTKLKYFKLEIDDHCEGPIFCRTLVASVFLPSLISLKMGIYDEEDCNEHDWPNGLFRQMLVGTVGNLKKAVEIPPKLNLRVLRLPPKFQDMSCIQHLIHFYPNITELELQTPSAAVVAELISHWTHLERLTMSLLDDEEMLWSAVLVGLKFVEDELNSQQPTKVVRTMASISNLTKLTFLDITITSKQTHGRDAYIKFPLNDWVIFYGLMDLPALQHIFVKGQQFSEKAIQCLEAQALPFCSMTFVN